MSCLTKRDAHMKVVRMTEAGRHILEAARKSERKGLQKNAGTMFTKRIFTMVMSGKIMA
jgi:hypothetical protein